MRIGGLQKITLVDYPGKVAATVFTQGCTFRCPYCHNPELVLPERFEPVLDVEEFFDFLATRVGKLEAVCITGGEPTVQPDLSGFIRRIKDLGFLVKLDSNGSRPKQLGAILAEGTVDYVAMDIKGPLEKYPLICGFPASMTKHISESIRLIMESGIDYEFRTTVADPLLDISDFHVMGRMITGAKRYFLQNYQDTKSIDGTDLAPFSSQKLTACQAAMRPFVGEVGMR
ncbi:MAG: anaerobic ribonucleoside-triphosphate reductase activating protein [bacterium]